MARAKEKGEDIVITKGRRFTTASVGGTIVAVCWGAGPDGPWYSSDGLGPATPHEAAGAGLTAVTLAAMAVPPGGLDNPVAGSAAVWVSPAGVEHPLPGDAGTVEVRSHAV